jgi:hypothetical protein
MQETAAHTYSERLLSDKLVIALSRQNTLFLIDFSEP